MCIHNLIRPQNSFFAQTLRNFSHQNGLFQFPHTHSLTTISNQPHIISLFKNCGRIKTAPANNSLLFKCFSSAAAQRSSAASNNGQSQLLQAFKEIPLQENGQFTQTAIPRKTPYEIFRTKNNNVPVYSKFKDHKMRMFTILRSYQGDVKTLRKDLQEALGPQAHIQEYVGRLEIEGDWLKQVKRWVELKGF